MHIFGVAVFNRYEKTNVLHKVLAINEVESVIRACEDEENDIIELLEHFEELSDILEYYADREIYVSEPVLLNDEEKVLDKVMTPREIEERYNLKPNSVGRDIQRIKEFKDSKLSKYFKYNLIRQSSSTWLIHELVADREYSMKPLLRNEYLQIKTSEDIEKFLLNFEEFAEVMTDDMNEYYVFQFDEKLDIGYSSHMIMKDKNGHFYYHHINNSVQIPNNKAELIWTHELVDLIKKYKNDINVVLGVSK